MFLFLSPNISVQKPYGFRTDVIWFKYLLLLFFWIFLIIESANLSSIIIGVSNSIESKNLLTDVGLSLIELYVDNLAGLFQSFDQFIIIMPPAILAVGNNSVDSLNVIKDFISWFL